MKKLYHLLFLASITVMAVGCGEKFIDADRTLKVDETAVTLTDVEQSKSIKVETDKENSYTATWQGGDWGRVEKQADGIIINVNANSAKNNRTATIHVVLEKGGKVEIVTIAQNGEEAMLDAIPSELTFNQLEGSKDITLLTNQSDWAVEVPSTDWSTVTTDRIKGVLTVGVLENTVEADRSFTIKLSSAASGLSKDIKIIQSGTLTYILPLLKFGATGAEILAFEEARGSVYQGNRNPYMIKTLSPIITSMYYSTDDESYHMTFVESYFDKDKIDRTKYDKLLNSAGYEFDFVEPSPWGDLDVFWNEPNKSYVAIFKGGGYITFAPLEERPNNPIQSKPMPTFSAFPFGFHTMDSDFEEIKTWEAKNGGTFKEELGTDVSAVFLMDAESAPLLARIYVKDGQGGLTGVSKITSVFSDISMAMYPCLHTNILTNEFKSLVSNAGWTPLNPKPDETYQFKHAEKGIHMLVNENYFRDLPGYENEYVLCFTLTPPPLTYSAPVIQSNDLERKPMQLKTKKSNSSLKNIAR